MTCLGNSGANREKCAGLVAFGAGAFAWVALAFVAVVVGCSESDGTDGASDAGSEPLGGETTNTDATPFAAQFGCHPYAVSDERLREESASFAACEGSPEQMSEVFGGFFVDALPCGACNAGDACVMGIHPLCDFDGDGPEDSEQAANLVEYIDEWVCTCEDGGWVCRENTRSPSACSRLGDEPI